MMIKSRSQRLLAHWLWLGVNLASLLPLTRLVWMVVEAPDSPGPVMFEAGIQQNIILFSGKTALILLVLSLLCTPVASILGLRQVLKVRKSLGLWGFFYAGFHALYFLGGKNLLSEVEAWQNVWLMLPSILGGLTKTPYARYGAYALLLLLPLAFTSNRLAMRLLRKNWKRLHRLVYLAVPLALYHYWQRQAFIVVTGETPEYWQPAIFAIVVGLLLLVRIPPLRHWLAARLNSEAARNQRPLAQRFSVSGRATINVHASDGVKADIEVRHPSPTAALSVVIWLIHIGYLWKRQRSKHEVVDSKHLTIRSMPDDESTPKIR